MSSTNSRPFKRPRNGLRSRRRSEITLSLVIRPSRDSGEANPHPDHARARRRAEGEGACRFRLTCVTRIFQKSVFTKFAHGRRPAAGSANVGRASPAMATATGTCLRCGSPVSRISTVISLLFFLGPVGDESRSRRTLRTTPDCRRKLTHWRHDGSRVGRGAHLRCREEELQGWGMAALVFRLLFTMRVVADRACNHSPKLSAKGDRRRRAPAQAYLNSSFRFADFASAAE